MEGRMHILFVAKDVIFAEHIKLGLVEKGFNLVLSFPEENWEAIAIQSDCELVILDIAISRPLCIRSIQSLRRRGFRSPILLLADVADVEACISGLDMGANDFLLNPFDLHALLTRIRELLGRKDLMSVPSLKARDLELDPLTRRVKRSGDDVELAPREFTLLEYMIGNPGQVLSRAVLRVQVWRCKFDTGTNVVDVYITYLRRKIDGYADTPKLSLCAVWVMRFRSWSV
jgi:DNA-binding response OmpR family regulator